jgi:Ca2+-binding EF-hand superfamily protein
MAAALKVQEGSMAFPFRRFQMKRFIMAAGLGLIMVGSALADPMGMAGADKKPKADANKDGKISLSEFQNSHLDRMMKLDTNQDGKITEAEFMAMKPMMGPGAPPPPPPPPGMDAKSMDHLDHKMGMGPDHKEHQSMMFDMIDRNDDGAITADEISALSAKQFKRMDKNADGFLTPDERPNWGKRGPKHDHDGPEPK